MNARVAAWVAWSLAALSVAMFIAGGVLYVLARSAQFPVDLLLFLADWGLFPSFVGLLYFVVIISGVVIALWSDGNQPQTPLWFELIFLLAGLGFAGVPIAIGLAVLKYRLYDIDVVINLTLVYGSLTAMLVALYFGAWRQPRRSSVRLRVRRSNHSSPLSSPPL